jgi:hypothetical protein
MRNKPYKTTSRRFCEGSGKTIFASSIMQFNKKVKDCIRVLESGVEGS